MLVTTQQYIAGQLAAQLRQLRKLSAAKDDLLAMVSHELRTPLTPVLLVLSDLQRAADIPEKYREEIVLAREQIELEARLVNDLLDLTRVVSRRLELRRSRCDVHGIIPSVVATARNQLNEKQLTLHQDLKAANCIVDGDADRLHQVLRNLLDNAIKFTPPGGSITIGTANENASLILAVRDTGIGMDANFCQLAFELFEQKDRSMTRAYGGMGVGLTLCRAIVEGHGGEIWASSEGEGKGSTITVRLPVMDPAAVK
jgi:signal transduction histidine kinase